MWVSNAAQVSELPVLALSKRPAASVQTSKKPAANVKTEICKKPAANEKTETCKKPAANAAEGVAKKPAAKEAKTAPKEEDDDQEENAEEETPTDDELDEEEDRKYKWKLIHSKVYHYQVKHNESSGALEAKRIAKEVCALAKEQWDARKKPYIFKMYFQCMFNVTMMANENDSKSRSSLLRNCKAWARSEEFILEMFRQPAIDAVTRG